MTTVPEVKAGAWFGGDRTLDEQLLGLESVLAGAAGKTVIDFGCAEGFIAHRFHCAGAARVDGCEMLIDRVEEARRINDGYRGTFFACDLDAFERVYVVNRPPLLFLYDVVLVLSIAHKLTAPDVFLSRLARMTAETMVVRLPSRVLKDKRSGDRAIDIPHFLSRRALDLVAEPSTCRGEWMGVFRKVPA